jgi:NDP-sugar pyrophosphorylase family protein
MKPRDVFALGPERWRAPQFREIPLTVPVPRYILGSSSSSMAFPLTSTVVMRVRHWLHVLRAGHLMPQVTLLERAGSQPIRSVGRAILSARLTKASRLRAMRKHFVYRGRNTYVHPTATVEASVLGDDVTVGAYSYVTNSVIGDGCVIEQRAHVSGSSLGPRTFVSLNSSLSACTTFGDTDACINGVQACVIAQKCGLTSFARPLDLAVGGRVRVEDDSALSDRGLREVGELPCGVAFGPGVFVGADVVIAAGRAIPAGVRLFVNADRVLQKVPAALAAGSYAVVDGEPLM